MKMSESIKDISAALVKAQEKIGKATKDAENPHFRSKYADLGAVLDACRAPLAEQGIAVVQAPSTEDGIVSVETMLLHTSGQWLSTTLGCAPAKADAQGIGSVITYFRRYGMAAMAGVAPEDDDGEGASGRGKSGKGDEMRPVATKKKEAPPPPLKPASIPVPSGDDMNASWKSWCETLLTAIKNAGTLGEVNEWANQNAPQIGGLMDFNPKTHAYVQTQIDNRRGVLAQAPSEDAA